MTDQQKEIAENLIIKQCQNIPKTEYQRLKEYQLNNREIINATNRRYKERNKDYIRDVNKEIRIRDSERIKESNQKYYKNKINSVYGKLKIIDNSLKFKYNISIIEYEKLLKQQNYVCAICNEQETHKTKNGNIKRLSVDHDHKTGKIRGLLCHRCNTTFGQVKENIQILINMISYKLKHTRKEP